jgi:hypothetical protein
MIATSRNPGCTPGRSTSMPPCSIEPFSYAVAATRSSTSSMLRTAVRGTQRSGTVTRSSMDSSTGSRASTDRLSWSTVAMGPTWELTVRT